MKYKRVPFIYGKGLGVLHYNRVFDKTVSVRQNLPGNIILIHGVNDVGTSYGEVEKGLCAGLRARMGWNHYKAGTYRMPGDKKDDKETVLEDPDAVFFKRQSVKDTDSPVIPFYWGFREVMDKAGTRNAQRVDRYGNRLDKDLSKNGGPFANATSSLPDMWGRGKSKAMGLLDWVQKDATHPVLDCPGRMYMILAAKRLAALITMIRDYDENEVVTLVAHSQGCLISLLAQAFLLQEGMRPADTLILNNPPYSLIDDIPMTTGWIEGNAGKDAAMQDRYDALDGRQTLHARLQTLVNIVQGVVKARHTEPALAALTNQAVHHGMVSGKWKAAADRDNRGKVYLYFCPEDMTVALNHVQGIGWQGVPDHQSGSQLQRKLEFGRGRFHSPTGREIDVCVKVDRQPMKELGPGFFQRVFTAKKRPDQRTGKAILIGQAKPHDFALRTEGEDDHAHTKVSESRLPSFMQYGRDFVRGKLPEPASNGMFQLTPEHPRNNLRTINGEPLPKAVEATMYAGAQTDAKGRQGGLEEVDPIDAAIAATSDYGGIPSGIWELHKDPTGKETPSRVHGIHGSPVVSVYPGRVIFAAAKIGPMQAILNQGKSPDHTCKVIQVFDCMGTKGMPSRTGEVLVQRSETPDAMRLRWQHASVARSFHGAIFGSADNHRQVTAYDVAIGGGKACTDPNFYKYLSAVADWRLQRNVKAPKRASIMTWGDFVKNFSIYWNDEPQWRRELIEGNANYYSTGDLPACVPALHVGLPSTVVCETMTGRRAVSAKAPLPQPAVAPAAVVGKKVGT